MNILGFMAASHYYHPRKCLVYPNSMSGVRLNMTQKKKKRERERETVLYTDNHWDGTQRHYAGERRQSPKEEHYIIPFI